MGYFSKSEVLWNKVYDENGDYLSFETEKGLTGKKGSGTFTLKGSNEDDYINMRYEIIVFVQNAAAQEIFLVFKDEDKYAEQIVERVLNSVELAKTIQK